MSNCTYNLHTNTQTYTSLGRGKWRGGGKKYRNVIQTVTLIFSVEMHRHTCTRSYTHRVQWPSHFLRRVPFSPRLSFCLSLNRSVAVVIKLAFLSLLCFPRRLNKRWRPRGQKERRREGGKQKERCKQKKTLRERGGKKKNTRVTETKKYRAGCVTGREGRQMRRQRQKEQCIQQS